jgi:hypothetical protein
MTGTVTLHETHFLESEIIDGDFPRDNTCTDVIECEDVEEAVALIQREGLSFAATGNSWAANPDGSRIVNYATGERVESSAHLSGWSEADEIAIMNAVG